MALFGFVKKYNSAEFQKIEDVINSQFDSNKQYSGPSANANLQSVQRRTDFIKEKYIEKVNKRSKLVLLGAGFIALYGVFEVCRNFKTEKNFDLSEMGKNYAVLESRISLAESAKKDITSAGNKYIKSLGKLNNVALNSDSSKVSEGTFYVYEATDATRNSALQINYFIDNIVLESEQEIEKIENSAEFQNYKSKKNQSSRNSDISFTAALVLAVGALIYMGKRQEFAAAKAEELKNKAKTNYDVYVSKLNNENKLDNEK